MSDTNDALLSLTGDVVTSFLLNNKVSADDLPTLISTTYTALQTVQNPAPAAEEAEEFVGAVTARKSLADPSKIISMIDGKPYSTLKRHLAGHGLTFAEYKARYNLHANYPSTAPAYSERRKALALQIGLGRKPKADAGTLSLGSALQRAKDRLTGSPDNDKG